MLYRRGTFIVGLLLAWPAALMAEAKVQFNRDVRPILSENCFLCHGPDAKTRKAKLRLDDREVAIARKAIVPGKPDDSSLLHRITSDDEATKMPPPESHKKLNPGQKEILQRWIAQGAEYQPHWAYVPLQRPSVPTVGDRGWVRNAIDSFILQNLESQSVKPSPEADRRTLLRRLSLDLIGLPPTPEEVEAFVKDTRPDAYERQVERLLASPHFGERMTVPWLDLVRFSDTVGYHGDQNQNVFPYRDYVIDSFNRNKPFDQFVIEQIAGDLLPNPTTEQRVATGFNRLNMMTREGGAQPKEYLAKYQADRVRTVGITFLGSTLGCAECHDHKYDPFTAKDFYSLSAFFADVKQWGVYQDYGYTPNPDLRGWSNDHPFPPEIEVDSPYLVRRRSQLFGQLRELMLQSTQDNAALGRWADSAREFLARNPDGWATPMLTLVGSTEEKAKEYVEEADRSILITGKGKRGEEHKFQLDVEPGWVAALRVELLPHAEHKGAIVRAGDATTVQLAASIKRADDKESKLAFYHADADHQEPRYANGFDILGIRDAWRTSGKEKKETQTGTWLLDRPFELKSGESLILSFKTDQAGCVRFSVSPFGFVDARQAVLPAGLREIVARPIDEWTLAQREVVQQAYFRSTLTDAAASKKYKELAREILECRDGKTMTMVSEAWKPHVTRVLPRGNWQDENGPVVEPNVPAFLPQPSKPANGQLTRLDLAQWLVSPANPLTARTFVNRTWKIFFGTGISGVMEDLGAQGEPPVHPELLDWLACEFRDKGWDVKHLVRLMVTSNTYRQDSRARPELKDRDPNNRWVSFQSPKRLEAEFVRDNALAIAGLLNRDLGGPSARPYQPGGYYVNLQFPNRDWVAHRDDRQYRRGIYTHWQRTFLHPMLANFDAPPREECTASRANANTPQQALTLLNDPSFNEAARVLAASVHKQAPNDESRLEVLFQRGLARSPKDMEKTSLLKMLNDQRSHYQGNQAEAEKLLKVGLAPQPAGVESAELAAWTNVCRVVLNLHETITRY